jgi:hypothetical protein
MQFVPLTQAAEKLLLWSLTRSSVRAAILNTAVAGVVVQLLAFSGCTLSECSKLQLDNLA